MQGQDGNFYGVNSGAYSTDYGVFYKMTPKGKLTAYPFSFTNGAYPNLPTQGTDGNFYGTAKAGGDPTCKCGVVYKVTTGGKITVLHYFKGYPTDGYAPVGVLVQGNAGNFYGTTYYGGSSNIGTLFKISSTGVFTLIHSFTGDPDGAYPQAGMILGSDGNFYGTTLVGGAKNGGAIYRLTPAGVETVLYNFCSSTGCADGLYAGTPIMQHTDGKFYGNTGGNSLGGNGVFYSFDMGLGPFVRTQTESGKVGATVEFLGQDFTGATGVMFNGAPASFKLVSDTFLTAIVPAAATTGLVSVITPKGTLTATSNFKVLPTIKTISPTSGPVGTTITITGSGLTGPTKVTVGGKAATFTVNNSSQITTSVPTGAKTGHIVVTTPGGTATSATSFTVTP